MNLIKVVFLIFMFSSYAFANEMKNQAEREMMLSLKQTISEELFARTLVMNEALINAMIYEGFNSRLSLTPAEKILAKRVDADAKELLMLPKYLSLTEHITPQEYDFLLSSVVMAIKAYQLGLDENKQHVVNSSKVSSN